MSWLSVLAPVIGGWLGMKGSESAANQAQQLTDQQQQMLAYILKLTQQYGEPFLEQLWQKLQSPDQESPYESSLWERARGDIDRSYRPAYGTALTRLSSRGQLTSPNSEAARVISGVDRARQNAIANLYMQKRAGTATRYNQNVEQFGNALAQMRGAGASGAAAFQQPIANMASLSQQGYGNTGDFIGQLLQYLQGKKLFAPATVGPWGVTQPWQGGLPGGGSV